MDAWAKQSGAEGKVTFLADGSANFAKAIGLSLDMSQRGLGMRSQRYSMLIDDGVVRKLSVEETPGKAEVSGADALLKGL
jgi:peroxiredoxin